MSKVVNGKIVLFNTKTKSDYFNEINDWIEKSDNGEEDRQLEISEQLALEYEKMSLQGKITFGFKYCENEENKLRGRVGKFSGWRTGTRAFKLMPDNKIPKSFSEEKTCIRYYDFGRMSWRSFKRDLFVVCTSFYNESDGQWYDNPEQAGFKNTWRNSNYKFKRSNRKDSQDEKVKRGKIILKEEIKRDKQIDTEIKRRLKVKKSEDIDLIKSSIINDFDNNINQLLDKSVIDDSKFIDLKKSLFTIDSIYDLSILGSELKSIDNQEEIQNKGCLILTIENENWLKMITELIPANVLDKSEGYEFDTHITILYGLNDDNLDIQFLKELIEYFCQKDGTLSEYLFSAKIGYFETHNNDVVKFEFSDSFLYRINFLIRSLFSYKNDFEYEPHATIAYVKKGLGQNFETLLNEPIAFKIKNIIYSSHLKEKTILKEFN